MVEDAERVIALAQLTEQVGLDLVTVQDHPYQPRLLDAWTLLSVIAAHTQTVRVSTNVANLPLRHPIVLARSVATLDRITGGRVELGLGAGGFLEAVAANAGPRLTAGESITALEEAIAIIREVWTSAAAVSGSRASTTRLLVPSVGRCLLMMSRSGWVLTSRGCSG